MTYFKCFHRLWIKTKILTLWSETFHSKVRIVYIWENDGRFPCIYGAFLLQPYVTVQPGKGCLHKQHWGKQRPVDSGEWKGHGALDGNASFSQGGKKSTDDSFFPSTSKLKPFLECEGRSQKAAVFVRKPYFSGNKICFRVPRTLLH